MHKRASTELIFNQEAEKQKETIFPARPLLFSLLVLFFGERIFVAYCLVDNNNNNNKNTWAQWSVELDRAEPSWKTVLL